MFGGSRELATARVLVPRAPVLVAGFREVLWLSPDGEIEVLYVDDCFGYAEEVVTAEFARHGVRPHAPRLSYAILRNERNVGNCASRNHGVVSGHARRAIHKLVASIRK